MIQKNNRILVNFNMKVFETLTNICTPDKFSHTILCTNIATQVAQKHLLTVYELCYL